MSFITTRMLSNLCSTVYPRSLKHTHIHTQHLQTHSPLSLGPVRSLVLLRTNVQTKKNPITFKSEDEKSKDSALTASQLMYAVA